MQIATAACLGIMLALHCASPSRAEVITQSLGSLPENVVQSKTSDCAKHLLVAAGKADNQSLWLDGKQVAKEMQFQGIGLSPAGLHYLYAARDGKRLRVVRDGKELGTFDDVDGFTADDDSHVAKFYFTPDGNRFGFVAKNDKKYSAVIDGDAGPFYYDVSHLVFSLDGKHVAYAANMDPDPATGAGSAMAIVDGKKIDANLPKFALIRNIAFVSSSSTVIYSGDYSVVLGGAVVVEDLVLRTMIVFSEDGKHFAFSGYRMTAHPSPPFETVVVVDGNAKVLQPVVPDDYPVVMYVAMSPDGKRVAYDRWDALGKVEQRRIQGRATTVQHSLPSVVTDEKPGAQLEGLKSNIIVFSPDSKHVGYLGQKADGWHLFLDDQEEPVCDDIAALAFSKDSQHYAYYAKRGDRWIAVLDGKDLSDFSVLPDFVPGLAHDEQRPSTLQFDPEGYLSFLAQKGGQVTRVRAKPEQGATGIEK